MSVLAPALIALVGFLVGIVLNILADDLPERRPVSRPRYPDGTPRPFTAWSGIAAFVTGQRASPGGARLLWRHPLTELATPALMLTAYFSGISDDNMTVLQMGFWLVYMAIFTLVTVIDLEHRLILFVVIIPSCALALLDAFTTAYGATPGEALLGAALGFAVFFILYMGGFAFTHVMARLNDRAINEVAFGYGDVMLITLSGLILGWRPLILAMFITVFLGAAGAIVYLIARRILARGQYQLFTPLPYGQYIIIATFIMLLFATETTGLLIGAR
jgi:prepilin signal peptidase PulO-like enzyme (type II secretory pathway)